MKDKEIEEILESLGFRKEDCYTVNTTITTNYQSKEFNFDEVVDNRLRKIKEILFIKAKEYIREDNPFHNMDCAANDLNKEPEDALVGMAIKHWISIKDMINDLYEGKVPTEAVIDEKFGDWIVWMILLEGLFKRRLNS